MLRREIGDLAALEERQRIGQDEKRVGPAARPKLGNSPLEGSGFPRLPAQG